MQLSKNFSLSEMVYSTTANKYKIDNTPLQQNIDNLRYLCEHCLQKIRDHFGIVSITSGFRCYELNKLVGGKANSQHLLGQAVDFVTPHAKLLDVFDWIVKNIDFDQVLFEKSKKTNTIWIHLSTKKTGNRHYSNRNYTV